MSAGLGDRITDVRNAARPNSARVSSPRTTGGATLVCDNLTGWPTASKVHFVTYKIDSSSNVVAGTQLDCYGIVSGNSITSFTVVDGTDVGHAVNDVVEMLPTAAWGQDLADGLNVQHNRTGTHKSITTDTIATTGNATVGGNETVAGTLAVTGATTLTGVLTPSGGLSAASVGVSALNTGSQAASVATSETTTSLTYAQLTTTTDQVTVTIGANGLALVAISAFLANSITNGFSYVGIAVSGASTVAASDDRAIIYQAYGNNAENQMGNAFLFTGLTAGSNTFKMVYHVSGNTGTFQNRRIAVVPL